MELKDKIIVITGGSDGIGKSLAKAFSNENAKVIISSNNKDATDTSAKELGVDSFVADVTSKEDIEKLKDYVVEKYGKVDIWVNNAGVQIAPSPVEEVDIEKLHKLIHINFFGYFYGCQVAVKQMKQQGDGLIINMVSSAGLEGKPYISAYSSSKFAVRGLTESIRKELENTDIKVYGIFPGGVQTKIYKEKYPDDFDDYMTVEQLTDKIINNLKQDNPEQDLIVRRPSK